MNKLNKTIKKRSYKNTGQTKKSNKDQWYAVNYLCILIFQSFEDFLTSNKMDETGNYVWISNYIQWVSSPILEQQWSVLKSNFANTTISFGDLLFNQVRNIKIQDYNDIKTLADKIVNSNEYKVLLDTR